MRLAKLSLFVAIFATLACAATLDPSQFTRQRSEGVSNREIVRSGGLTVTVATPSEALHELKRLIQDAGGFIEWSNVSKDENVSLRTRVPEPRLEEIMDAIASLGSEDSRSISAADVTEQHTDLATRLKNSLALRDRLQLLLDRASDVEDVLAIEKELNRVQSDVETMQASLDRLDSQIALSELSITLQRKQILGPLGYLGYGLWWTISKLFVIR